MDLKEAALSILREWRDVDSIKLKKLSSAPIDLLLEKDTCQEYANALDRQLAFGESDHELRFAYQQFETRFYRLREKIIYEILRSES
jgi:hypothetical protein